MNTNSFFYPFDPTGLATTNLVSGERQVVNAPGVLDFYYIVPKAGPYFRESLQLIRYPSGVPMVEGVDYVCSHLFHAATHSTGKGVYGSITFYDHTLTGTVSLQYQTIGGDWVIGESKILEVLANIQIDPRITTWDETVDVPFQFPVIAHEFNVDDFVGADDVVAKLLLIKEAIVAASSGSAASHVLDFENPHRTTKKHVGLEFVDNFPTASLQQAQVGTTNSAFMTPLRTAQAIQALSWVRIDTHVQRVDNPHEVTKAQVGLGNVENLIIASIGEAEAGSTNARYMSPARTKDAISAQAVAPLTAYINRRDNPNQVTASQVGLGNVSNFATGTSQDAQDGTASDKFLSVREIVGAINYHIKDAFTTHAANTANPHFVTATQVGLGNVGNYGLADLSAAQAGSSNELYMTPWSTHQLVLALGGSGSDSGHALLKDNPHNVTALQVGLGNVADYLMATKPQAEAGVLSTAYMNPVTTKNAIQFQVGTVLQAHVDSTSNPHNVTAAQVGTYSSATIDIMLADKMDAGGVANDTLLVFGQTKGELLADIGNLTVNNSLHLGGVALDDLPDYLSGMTVNNAMHLEGLTTQEILTAFINSGRAGANQSIIAPVVPVIDSASPLVSIKHNETWTMLGRYKSNILDLNDVITLSFMIEGGSNEDSLNSPVSLVNLTIDKDIWSGSGNPDFKYRAITSLNAFPRAYEIFTRAIADNGAFYLEIWSKDGRLRNTMAITDLSNRCIGWIVNESNTDNANVILVEPAGLIAVDLMPGIVYENSLDTVFLALEDLTARFDNL